MKVFRNICDDFSINSELFAARVRVLFSKKLVVNTRSRKRHGQIKSFISVIILTAVNTSEFKITRLVQSIMWLGISATGFVCVFNFQNRIQQSMFPNELLLPCVSRGVNLNSEFIALSQFAGRQN